MVTATDISTMRIHASDRIKKSDSAKPNRGKQLSESPFFCSVCGQMHDELPDIAWAKPDYWLDHYARTSDCLLTEDLCIIENRDFFVRGVIEIPILDSDDVFCWGVWVSHKKENFEMYRKNRDSDKIGPYFGWLSTNISYFKQTTLNLQTMAHYKGKDLRPRIVLGPSAHPLYAQQRDGITLENAWLIAHYHMSGC